MKKQKLFFNKISLNKFIICSLFLAISTIFGYKMYTDSVMEELYLEYYEPYPNIITSFETTVQEEQELYSDFFSYYDAGHFNKALSLINTSKEQVSDLYLDFYIAQCYMAIGNYRDAKSILEHIVDGQKGLYSESLWYLCLLEIKNGHRERTITNLESLIKGGNYKIPEAHKILDELQ